MFSAGSRTHDACSAVLLGGKMKGVGTFNHRCERYSLTINSEIDPMLSDVDAGFPLLIHAGDGIPVEFNM